jgi:hypothetical protein
LGSAFFIAPNDGLRQIAIFLCQCYAERIHAPIIAERKGESRRFFQQSNLVVEFCNEVNRLLQRKIKSADWWGLIIKGNATLFLESADSIYENVKCTSDYRLSSAISNFKGYHLYVHGSQLSTKVTAKKEKS